MARFVLIRDEAGYGLADQLSAQHPLRIDFLTPQLQYRRKHGGKKELLIKAVNARPGLKVWDCTAGLGVDSFLLALQGCEVLMFERSAILALLLEQAMAKAATLPELAPVMARMSLLSADSRSHLRSAVEDTIEAPDVIFIDPMFPSRRKRAQVKGTMQMLQNFLGKDEDAEELLRLALQSGSPRIVVKRPSTGVQLSGPAATFSLAAKANRFDVFLDPVATNDR